MKLMLKHNKFNVLSFYLLSDHHFTLRQMKYMSRGTLQYIIVKFWNAPGGWVSYE